MLLPCNENVPPPSPFSGDVHRCSQKGAVSEKIAAMRDKLSEKSRREKEAELARSPTLVQLQRESAKKERPARGSVMARQRELERLHHEAKSRLEGVGGIGGGVSLWPAMDDMRLSRSDAVQLAFLCLSLILSTTAVFFMCHGTGSRGSPLLICSCWLADSRNSPGTARAIPLSDGGVLQLSPPPPGQGTGVFR